MRQYHATCDPAGAAAPAVSLAAATDEASVTGADAIGSGEEDVPVSAAAGRAGAAAFWAGDEAAACAAATSLRAPAMLADTAVAKRVAGPDTLLVSWEALEAEAGKAAAAVTTSGDDCGASGGSAVTGAVGAGVAVKKREIMLK